MSPCQPRFAEKLTKALWCARSERRPLVSPGMPREQNVGTLKGPGIVQFHAQAVSAKRLESELLI